VHFAIEEGDVVRLKTAAKKAEKLAKTASTAESKANLATMASDALQGYAEEAAIFLDAREKGKVELTGGHCDALRTGIVQIIIDLRKEKKSLGDKQCEVNEVEDCIKKFNDLFNVLRKGANNKELELPLEEIDEEEESEQAELATT
jgi:hypothetical protein